MLMFHHGVIDIPKPVSAGLDDVLEWASKHQNGALDMVFLLGSHCEGDQCEQRFEAELKKRGIRTISTTELKGKTVADLVKLSTLPTGGAVLAVLDWDRDGNVNYDENVQCVEAITLQKCFTNSIPFVDSPVPGMPGLLHYGPGPLDRMMKYIHKTVEDGHPADGSLWGVQCLWQQSGTAFAALKRGPVKQEEFSGLNKLVTKKIKDGEIDSSKLNIVGVDNVCDGGLGLAAALQKTSIERFTNTGKYAPRISCNCLTPNAGAAGHNGYRCADGTTGYCSSHQECYADSSFIKGDWGKACQITCKCRTPDTGTAGHNGYYCSDGTTGACASNEYCIAHSSFIKGDWAKGCENKGPSACKCRTPNAGTAGHNEYWCTDGTTGACASNEECYAVLSFKKGDWGKGCQITCKCRTPNAGTAGHNGYYCTDGTGGYCSSHEVCYADSSFKKGRWDQGCRSAHRGL